MNKVSTTAYLYAYSSAFKTTKTNYTYKIKKKFFIYFDTKKHKKTIMSNSYPNVESEIRKKLSSWNS